MTAERVSAPAPTMTLARVIEMRLTRNRQGQSGAEDQAAAGVHGK